jgi:hypothetical protein
MEAALFMPRSVAVPGKLSVRLPRHAKDEPSTRTWLASTLVATSQSPQLPLIGGYKLPLLEWIERLSDMLVVGDQSTPQRALPAKERMLAIEPVQPKLAYGSAQPQI